MRQRGRKSATQSEVSAQVVDIGLAQYAKAPGDLNTAEKAMFNEIVAARPADFFDAATVPLLAEYCRIPTELGLISSAISKFKDSWLNTDEGLRRFKELTAMRDRAQKRMALLATKMRLAQQSRYIAHSGKSKPKSSGSGGPKPWEG